MARVTVEDCEKVEGNRFDLVVLAAQRARQILSGDPLTIEKKDNKNPVLALREIAARTVSRDALIDSSINSFRVFTDEEEIDFSEELLDDDYSPCANLAIDVDNEDISIVDESEIDDLPDDGDDELTDSDKAELLESDTEELEL